MELNISMNMVLNILHSMLLSTSNKRWLADHLYEEVMAEEKRAHACKPTQNCQKQKRTSCLRRWLAHGVTIL